MEPDSRRKQHIERFVRDVLGCRCPDEVFRTIEAMPGPEPAPGVYVKERIVIGMKLLIYLVGMPEDGDSKQYVEVLVNHGVGDRDRHGLNRFRLVLASERPERAERMAREAFQRLSLPDERVHLHVVPLSSLP